MHVFDDEAVAAESSESRSLDAHASTGRIDTEQGAVGRAGQNPTVRVAIAINDQLDALEVQVGKCGEESGRPLANRFASTHLADATNLANHDIWSEDRSDRVRVMRVPCGIRAIVDLLRPSPVDHDDSLPAVAFAAQVDQGL